MHAREVCRACGTLVDHDVALLDGLAGHRRALDEQQREVEHAQREHAQAEVSRSLGRGWPLGLVGSWLLAGLLAPLSSLLALAIFAAPFVALTLVIATRRRAFERAVVEAQVQAEALPLHCPTCGGQSESRPAAPLLACRYCSGALAADERALAKLLARARASTQSEVHRARMAAWRLAAAQGREPASDLVPYFVIGGLGSLWVIGTLLVDLRGLFGGPLPGGGELVAMHLVALALVLGVGLPLGRRRARVRRWMLALRQLGEVRHALPDEAQWLCRHGLGELAPARLRGGLGYGFVAGPGWAVSLAPWSIAAGEAGDARHVEVLLPGTRGTLLERRARALERLGFVSTWHEGGLVAALPRARLDVWLADPRSLAELRATLDAR
jgi:hypothetical protein